MAENRKNISILLIDDESFALKISIRVLNNLGYLQVETAIDGNEALGKLVTSEKPIDLIICDLNMPEMDGIEFMRHANGSGFQGGMILLSGEDSRMLETVLGLAKAHGLHILGALQKPLKSAELELLLNNFEPVQSEERHYSPQKPITEKELIDGIRGSATNQLYLVYQPKINVKTFEVAGVETLARWWNKDRGMLGPATFIPVAEASGQIDNLTNVIYERALAQVAEWSQQGINLRTAINFSVNSFAGAEFCKFLVDTKEKYALDFEQIVLEVTETQAMSISLDCLEALMSLRLKRFGLSIDDFGTGNSSLAQLKNIPFTELKIDRAFVHGAARDASALAILEASVNLAKKLSMEIVAEGAETREDWDLIERLGCDYVQGFYCAKPMRNEDLIQFLEKWTGPH